MTYRNSVIAASALLVCCACGSPQSDPGATPIGQAEQSVRSMDARVTGTSQQRVDGLFLDYVQAQSALVDCFKTHGAIYQPSPFGQPERPTGPAVLTAPLPVAMSVYLDEEAAMIDQQIALARAEAAVRPPTSPDLGTDNFEQAAAACSPATGSQARYRTAASDAWSELLGRAGTAPGASISDADYVSCMNAQGVHADSAESAFGPYPELRPMPTSPESARAAALRRARADAGCRRESHLAFVEAAAAALPIFESTHAHDIAKAEAMWQQISRDADKARTTWYAAHPELPRL